MQSVQGSARVVVTWVLSQRGAAVVFHVIQKALAALGLVATVYVGFFLINTKCY